MARAIKNYNEVVGHANIIDWIKGAVKKDKVPNVIIFHGNPGLGKTTLAKLLAVDVVAMNEPASKREEYIKAVIEQNRSTDSIKLFNMSEIQEKEEEVQKVKSELTLGFSVTGRKVLILDEAHNMSRKAQDAVLVELEHLQEGVYVFICTTEIGSLRDALVSRSKATIQLNDLSQMEFRRLMKSEIAYRKLTFGMSLDLVLAFLASWSGNQPRKAINLLESFADGSFISSEELSIFINIDSASNAIEMVKYLYGSVALGIDFINSLRIDRGFIDALIDVTKVVFNGKSLYLSPKEEAYIREFMSDKDSNNLLRFTAEVAGLSALVKRRVIAAFIRCNIQYSTATPIKNKMESDLFRQQDLRILAENVSEANIGMQAEQDLRVESLEELFSGKEVVE